MENTNEKFTTSRRNFLKGMGGMALGMGMMPVLELFGIKASAEEAQATAEKAFDANTTILHSDALTEALVNQPMVDTDLTLPDGTVIPAVYVNLRNRINRIGQGIGSIPAPNGYEMIMYLWSEEDAANYLKMPLHKFFTAANYAELTGWDEAKCLEILEDQAHRNLIWRVRRGGLAWFLLMPYINGFWEFNELDALMNQGGLDKVFEFDTKGISGADVTGIPANTTFALFRSYPISADVVEGGKLADWQDWRALIARNPKITVSPCQCRTMWTALGVPFPEEHPMETCLSLGEMAEYFEENKIGRVISQEEAVAVVEDIISKGMVVESICAKNADIICCCHSKSCGNLMALRGRNGEGTSTRFWSAYDLKYDKDKCVGCGICVSKCPMDSITIVDGKCVMDKACVRCGQCVPVCPMNARILTPTEGYPELPEDYADCNLYFAKDRMARGDLVDFTDTKLEG